jgi:hypothetical protein
MSMRSNHKNTRGVCLAGTHRRTLCSLLIVAMSMFLSNCTEVNAIGEVVLFSALSGKVFDKGKPVAGVTLERETKWTWGKETIKDIAVTGNDGSFAFPSIKRRMLIGSLLPHETVILQDINLSLSGTVHGIWLTNKRNYESNGELHYFDDSKGMTSYRNPSKPMQVRCSLDTQPERRGTIFGLCEFE